MEPEIPKAERRFYFAYGSNMNQAQMRERCPDSKLVGKAVLKDYKIGFSILSPSWRGGCADVVQSLGDQVWGLLYEVSEEDLESLNKFEGHPYKYKRFTATVTDESGEQVEAESYEVVERSLEHVKPSEEYIGRMVEAGKLFSFPEQYVRKLESVERQES